MWESLQLKIVILALNLDLFPSAPRLPSSRIQGQGPGNIGDRRQPSGPTTDQGIGNSFVVIIKFLLFKIF